MFRTVTEVGRGGSPMSFTRSEATSMHRYRSVHLTALLALALLQSFPAQPLSAQSQRASAQAGGALFPEPFRVDHFVVNEDASGEVFRSEGVSDYYGGHWIVSVRPDGSRVVIDLEQQELTEILPSQGQYRRIGLARYAELTRRLREIQGYSTGGVELEAEGAGGGPRSLRSRSRSGAAAVSSSAPELTFTERPTDASLLGGTSAARGRAVSTSSASIQRATEAAIQRVSSAATVRRLTVSFTNPSAVRTASGSSLRSGEQTSVEAWMDSRVALGARALDALEALEHSLQGRAGDALHGSSATLQSSDLLNAARRHASGAFLVRTRRPVDLQRPVGWIEDVATALERLDAFPSELLEVPAGLERAPHPLEVMVSVAEREAELERLMGGRRPVGAGGPQP